MLRTCLLAGLLAACASAPTEPYVSDDVADLTQRDLGGVVLLHRRDPGVGTAAIVGPHRLFTARHVADMLVPDPTKATEIGVHGRFRTVRIVAAGNADEPGGDWALLEVDGPRFAADRVVRIHAPALAADWSPPPDAEVVVTGYASAFYAGHQIDLRAPTPRVSCRVLADSPTPGEFACTHDGRFLAGMSGGPAWIRNPVDGRLEVIGIHVAGVEESSRWSGPFGLSIGLGSTRTRKILRLPAAIRTELASAVGR